MEEMKKIRNKWFLKILLISAFIILISSLESFMMAKDSSLFEIFKENSPSINEFSDYLNIILINYIFSIIIPIIISIYTFFTIDRYGFNFDSRNYFYYRLFFGGMIVIQIVNMILRFNLSSIFYYINIILYIIFLIFVTKKPIKSEGDL